MNARRAFTLIELLVVVAIIAVLIAILLPSLSKAKDRAQAVKCQANLRSIYQAMTIYETSWDGFMMPERCGQEGVSANWPRWYGPLELGVVFGMGYTIDPKDPNIEAISEKVKKMLDCPSTNHPTDANGRVIPDYTYSQRMGDHRYYDPDASKNPFVKKSNVRRETLVALDASQNVLDKDTDHFRSVGDLVPFDDGVTNGQQSNHRAGRPHNKGKQANMLFADGQILAGDPNKLLNNDWIVDYRQTKGVFPFK